MIPLHEDRFEQLVRGDLVGPGTQRPGRRPAQDERGTFLGVSPLRPSPVGASAVGHNHDGPVLPVHTRGRVCTAPDAATFYGGDHRGHTDYPTLGA